MSSLPPHRAGVGSAVNDLVPEPGGALGIGVLGSVTLAEYRSRLGSVVAGHLSGGAGHVVAGRAERLAGGEAGRLVGGAGHVVAGGAVAQARAGLAQPLAGFGGGHTAGGLGARNAYSSGLDLAMIVGAVLVAVAAGAVGAALPGQRAAAAAASRRGALVEAQTVSRRRSAADGQPQTVSCRRLVADGQLQTVGFRSAERAEPFDLADRSLSLACENHRRESSSPERNTASKTASRTIRETRELLRLVGSLTIIWVMPCNAADTVRVASSGEMPSRRCPWTPS
jgi:hypothetical protein